MKSKAQQIQFFKQCLIPQYSIDVQKIDFRAHVDSELSTTENWDKIKQEYGLGTNNRTNELQFMQQQIHSLRERVEELELELQEVKE